MSKTLKETGTTIDNTMTITLGMGPPKIILYKVAAEMGPLKQGIQGKGKKWWLMDRKKCLLRRELKELGAMKIHWKEKRERGMNEGETVLLEEQGKGHLCERGMGHLAEEESHWIGLWIQEDHLIEKEKVLLIGEEQNHLTEEGRDLLTEEEIAHLRGEGRDHQTEEAEIKNLVTEIGMITV